MSIIFEKTSDPGRALLYGLLGTCFFYKSTEDCPLQELRNSLSSEEKYDLVMRLSNEEVKRFIEQHESCLEKRLSYINP